MAMGTLLLQGHLEDTEGISMGMAVGIQPPQRHLEDIYTGTWTSPPQEHLKLDEDVRDTTTPGASGEHWQGIGMGSPPPCGTWPTERIWGWGHHHPRDTCSK